MPTYTKDNPSEKKWQQPRGRDMPDSNEKGKIIYGPFSFMRVRANVAIKQKNKQAVDETKKWLCQVMQLVACTKPIGYFHCSSTFNMPWSKFSLTGLHI